MADHRGVVLGGDRGNGVRVRRPVVDDEQRRVRC
jgi:hypothetical protein